MNKLDWYDYPIAVINVLAVLSLCIGLAAPYISPETFWYPAIFGLGIPYILGGTGLLLIYWLLRKKWWWMLNGGLLILGYFLFGNILKFNTSGSEDGIHVMSYNVRLFDLYNWTSNKETRNKMFDFLNEEQPDILCMQEYFHSKQSGYFLTTDTLKQFLNANKVATEYTVTKMQVHFFGMATYSAYPIIHQEAIRFDGEKTNNACLITDLNIGQDTVRVLNVHLASLHFSKTEYDFIEQIGDNNTDQNLIGSGKILSLLNLAYQKRASQVEQLSALVEQSPYSIILCGDFNDTPVSYAYNTLQQGLNDAFCEAGFGISSTYNGKIPALRIDHILTHPDFKVNGYQRHRIPYSDHYPISAWIKLG